MNWWPPIALAALTALMFGAGCALLWAWGGVLLRLWSGSTALYDPLLLAVMLAPLIIVPGTQLNLPLLTYGHRPGSFALAVTLQTAAAALLTLFLPISSIAVRLSLALSLAEILFLAPVIALATRRMIGNAATHAALPDCMIAVSSAAVTVALSLFVQRFAGGLAGMISASLLTMLLACLPVLWFARGLIRSFAAARAGAVT